MYYMFTNDLVFSLIDSFLAQHDYFFYLSRALDQLGMSALPESELKWFSRATRQALPLPSRMSPLRVRSFLRQFNTSKHLLRRLFFVFEIAAQIWPNFLRNARPPYSSCFLTVLAMFLANSSWNDGNVLPFCVHYQNNSTSSLGLLG